MIETNERGEWLRTTLTASPRAWRLAANLLRGKGQQALDVLADEISTQLAAHQAAEEKARRTQAQQRDAHRTAMQPITHPPVKAEKA